MESKKGDILYASRMNQRSIEFYNAAESLRKNFWGAVNVIDYCTALSFELKAKAIIFLDEQPDSKFYIHKICTLFDKCGIDVNRNQYKNLIKFYEHVLNNHGRYSVKNHEEREKHYSILSGIGIKVKKHPKYSNLFTNEINSKEYTLDYLYKDIWKELCEIYDKKVINVHNRKNTLITD